MQHVIFQDLGLMDYKEAWDYQEKLHAELVNNKLLNRKHPTPLLPAPNSKLVTDKQPDSQRPTPKHHLLFCEHPHVYTLGRSGHEQHLLIDEKGLMEKKAAFYKNNRGGDITYHGPGQLVGYPIFDLNYFFTDIHKYLRYLEEAVILTLKEYNIASGRIEGLTGVWIDSSNKIKARKICAFGVRCSRWVTMHGFAFNVNTDLSYFGNIIPCGIQDKAVTSLEKELGRKIDLDEVKDKVKKHIAVLFGILFFEEYFLSTIKP